MGDLETKTSDDDKFRNFVKDLLKKHSGLNDETVDILTDAAGLPLFQQAFTSKTFSPLNNYEQLEFIGDTLVNDAVSLFIFNKYPGFTVEWLTLIKHSIISSLGLSTVANELNFWPHIRYKLERKYNEKEQLLEDVLEAFIGALRQVIDSKASEVCGADPPFGLGTLLTQKFIFSVLEKMVTENPNFISDSWGKVKDPKTRIKELMSKHGFGHIHEHLTSLIKPGRGWESVLYIGKKKLTSGVMKSKKLAEQDVSRQAITLFQSRNYEEKIPPKTIAAPPSGGVEGRRRLPFVDRERSGPEGVSGPLRESFGAAPLPVSFQSSAPSPAPSLQPAEPPSSFQPASPPPSPHAALLPQTPPLQAAPSPAPPLRIQAEGFRPPSPQIFPRRPQFVRRLQPPRRISTQPFQNRLPSAEPHFNFHRRTEPNFHHRFRQFPSSRRWYI